MENVLEKFKTTRILGLIGVIGLVLGVMCTYLSVNMYITNYNFVLINYWEGKTIFALTLLNALYIFKDYAKKYCPKIYDSEIGRKADELNDPKLLLVPVALIVILTLYVASVLNISSDYRTYGAGFVFLWSGVISLVAHSFLYQYNTQDNIDNNEVNMNNQNQDYMNNNAQIQNNVGQVRYCQSCGSSCEINTKFCAKCGSQVI